MIVALAMAWAQAPEASPPAEPVVEAAAPPECPDVNRWIAIARNDTQSFFLVDARNDLLEAVEGFACSAEADPEPLAAFYSVQGLLWWYEDRPEKAQRALAAAKELGASFDPELGDDLAPEWEAATLPEGAPVALTLENRGAEEWLAIDGVRTDDDRVAPGLHLLQVGQGATARFARVVDVDGGAPLVVALPTVAAVVAEPAVAEPEPEPVAPPPLVSGGALRKLSRRVYEAPDGSELAWRPEVIDLAKADDDGRTARRRLRRNGFTQGLVVTGTALFAYNSYLLVWDATTGRNLPLSQSAGGAAFSAGLAVGGGLWERGLIRRRARWRQQVADGAGRSWSAAAGAEPTEGAEEAGDGADAAAVEADGASP